MTTPLTSVRAQERLPREEDGFAHEQVPEERVHASVMAGEVATDLAPNDNDQILDATAGEGGHSELLLSQNSTAKLLALDADPRSVVLVRDRLASFGNRAEVVEANFADLAEACTLKHITTLNKVLFDLGWNSGQLYSGRGFSFMHDEPLLMSYGANPASKFNAEEILNGWSEETLANVFFGYGEERYARRIAKHIVEIREKTPLRTTFDLVAAIRASVPAAYARGRINPATRTFQALRIAVNDELGVIERGVGAAWQLLAPGGRIGVITFHSIEDRAVKRLFAGFVKEGGKLVHKKPLTPTREEIHENPRSRSAKFRVIEKL